MELNRRLRIAGQVQYQTESGKRWCYRHLPAGQSGILPFFIVHMLPMSTPAEAAMVRQ
jgi:hypothetical protein